MFLYNDNFLFLCHLQVKQETLKVDFKATVLQMLKNKKWNKKRRNATKPDFQRFNQVLRWQE